MRITFPGGFKVNAEHKGFVIETDQPVPHGGGGTAPSPFDYFLASIGTCAGLYAHRFLVERNLPTEGLGLELSTTEDPETGMVTVIHLDLTLPEGFPEKYERAIKHSVNLCSVKKHVLSSPRFSTTIVGKHAEISA